MATKQKFPSIPYSVLSPSKAVGDKVLLDLNYGEQVVITEKLDGENSTLYADGFHARSIDSQFHESRSWLVAHHARIRHLIDPNLRIIVENMYAQHSIRYENLQSYAYVTNVMIGDYILPWSEAELWAEIIGLPAAPVLYKGKLAESVVNGLINNLDLSVMEGFVCRPADGFTGVTENMWKWVRDNHVQTDKHWTSNWAPNPKPVSHG